MDPEISEQGVHRRSTGPYWSSQHGHHGLAAIRGGTIAKHSGGSIDPRRSANLRHRRHCRNSNRQSQSCPVGCPVATPDRRSGLSPRRQGRNYLSRKKSSLPLSHDCFRGREDRSIPRTIGQSVESSGLLMTRHRAEDPEDPPVEEKSRSWATPWEPVAAQLRHGQSVSQLEASEAVASQALELQSGEHPRIPLAWEAAEAEPPQRAPFLSLFSFR